MWRYFVTWAVAFCLALVGGVQAATNQQAGAASGTNAPGAIRRPVPLARSVSTNIAAAAPMALAGPVCNGAVAGLGSAVKVASVAAVAGLGRAVLDTNGVAVVRLGHAVVGTNGAVVAGLGRAAVDTNGAVVVRLGRVAVDTNGVVVAGLGRAVLNTNIASVAGISPAGRVMVNFVREMNRQYSVGDDVAFLADVDVWRGGPLGEIVTQAMQARRRGDEEAYQALLARYWVEYGAAIDRRRVLGKTGTQRPVPGR